MHKSNSTEVCKISLLDLMRVKQILRAILDIKMMYETVQI